MEQYRLVDHIVSIGGREWRIRAVADQDELVNAVTDENHLERFPYGMLLWPSAVALSAWLAENWREITGRRVLELGAGAGLPGIVARWLGADVCQTDYLPGALALAERNSELDGGACNE